MATHSSVLAWRIQWAEVPGGVTETWPTHVHPMAVNTELPPCQARPFPRNSAEDENILLQQMVLLL